MKFASYVLLLTFCLTTLNGAIASPLDIRDAKGARIITQLSENEDKHKRIITLKYCHSSEASSCINLGKKAVYPFELFKDTLEDEYGVFGRLFVSGLTAGATGIGTMVILLSGGKSGGIKQLLQIGSVLSAAAISFQYHYGIQKKIFSIDESIAKNIKISETSFKSLEEPKTMIEHVLSLIDANDY